MDTPHLTTTWGGGASGRGRDGSGVGEDLESAWERLALCEGKKAAVEPWAHSIAVSIARVA